MSWLKNPNLFVFELFFRKSYLNLLKSKKIQQWLNCLWINKKNAFFVSCPLCFKPCYDLSPLITSIGVKIVYTLQGVCTVYTLKVYTLYKLYKLYLLYTLWKVNTRYTSHKVYTLYKLYKMYTLYAFWKVNTLYTRSTVKCGYTIYILKGEYTV